MIIDVNPEALIAIKWASAALATTAVALTLGRLLNIRRHRRQDELFHQRALKMMEHAVATGRTVLCTYEETTLKPKS